MLTSTLSKYLDVREAEGDPLSDGLRGVACDEAIVGIGAQAPEQQQLRLCEVLRLVYEQLRCGQGQEIVQFSTT